MKRKGVLPKLSKLRRLPKTRRALFALWVYDALMDDKRWNARFAKSQALLAQLADAALAEYEAGKTRPLIVDEL